MAAPAEVVGDAVDPVAQAPDTVVGGEQRRQGRLLDPDREDDPPRSESAKRLPLAADPEPVADTIGSTIASCGGALGWKSVGSVIRNQFRRQTGRSVSWSNSRSTRSVIRGS